MVARLKPTPKLNDLPDVDTSGVADDDFFYYDAATGLWKPRKLVDADIPDSICRDAEADAKVAAHAALTTGVHGLGSLHAAGFHSAGQAVSKFIWKDVSERALADHNRTSTLDWTDLDLTAYTSSAAKIVICRIIALISWTSGNVLIYLRKNGTTPTHAQFLSMGGVPTGIWRCALAICGMDSDQVIEYKISIDGTAEISTYIDVLGYIE